MRKKGSRHHLRRKYETKPNVRNPDKKGKCGNRDMNGKRVRTRGKFLSVKDRIEARNRRIVSNE